MPIDPKCLPNSRGIIDGKDIDFITIPNPKYDLGTVSLHAKNGCQYRTQLVALVPALQKTKFTLSKQGRDYLHIIPR